MISAAEEVVQIGGWDSYDPLCVCVCFSESECWLVGAVRRELMVMKLVAHPHVVRLYEVIETPTEICMVMEYVESGDLFDYIVLNGRLSEDESRHFFQQVNATLYSTLD